MKPYTEVYDRWSFMNPDAAEPGGRRLPRRDRSSPATATNSCQCRTPIETYYGSVGPRLGAGLQPERSDRAARRPTASTTRAAARSAAAPARATAPARSASRPTRRFPSPNGFAPAYNWNNGVPAYRGAAVLRSDAQRRLRDRPRRPAAASPTAIPRSAGGRRAIRTGTPAFSTR